MRESPRRVLRVPPWGSAVRAWAVRGLVHRVLLLLRVVLLRGISARVRSSGGREAAGRGRGASHVPVRVRAVAATSAVMLGRVLLLLLLRVVVAVGDVGCGCGTWSRSRQG